METKKRYYEPVFLGTAVNLQLTVIQHYDMMVFPSLLSSFFIPPFFLLPFYYFMNNIILYFNCI